MHRDGALAEYLAVPQRFVCKAEGISLDDAAMIEFLAIGAHAVRRAAIQQGEFSGTGLEKSDHRASGTFDTFAPVMSVLIS